MKNSQTVLAFQESWLAEPRVALDKKIAEYLGSIVVDQTGAFLSQVAETKLRSQAETLANELKTQGEKLFKEKPLAGVCIGIKDNIAVEGEQLTCGSRILEKYRAPYSATVIERCEKAGALIFGKLNLDEFAMGSSGENSAYLKTSHPTHPDRVCGGSSSGSALAVAGRLVDTSLGSDTGGSIRLPASFCGTFGLKPTYGRVSRYGLVAYGSSLDQIGPLSNSLSDLELMARVIYGSDPRDSTSVQTELAGWNSEVSKSANPRPQFGFLADNCLEGLQPEIRLQYEVLKEQARSKGAQVSEIDLGFLKQSVPVYYIIAMCEASSNLSRFDGVRYQSRAAASFEASKLDEFYESTRALFGSEVKKRILLGAFALSSGYYDDYYLKAAKVRRLIAQELNQVFQKIEAIVLPTSSTTAFKKGERQTDPVKMFLSDLYTVVANLAGVPALAFPHSKDNEGLPIGFQIMGPGFSDEKLVIWAEQYLTQAIDVGAK